MNSKKKIKKTKSIAKSQNSPHNLSFKNKQHSSQNSSTTIKSFKENEKFKRIKKKLLPIEQFKEKRTENSKENSLIEKKEFLSMENKTNNTLNSLYLTELNLLKQNNSKKTRKVLQILSGPKLYYDLV